jgi:polyisoprenoid-binding protein YceI
MERKDYASVARVLHWLIALPNFAMFLLARTVMSKDIHEFTANVLLFLIVIHLAALRHAAVLKDGIMSRMLPRFGRRAASYRIVLLVLAASALGFVGLRDAAAMEWGINPQKSEVTFLASGSGCNMKGIFMNYKTDIEFDPEMPDEASVQVMLDMRSASTGADDADKTLLSEEFFDPGRYPTAEFAGHGAKPNGDEKYILDGRLTPKGVTKPVSLPFSNEIAEARAAVKAALLLPQRNLS